MVVFAGLLQVGVVGVILGGKVSPMQSAKPRPSRQRLWASVHHYPLLRVAQLVNAAMLAMQAQHQLQRQMEAREQHPERC